MKNKNIILVGVSCVLLALEILGIWWFEKNIFYYLARPVFFIGLIFSLLSLVLSIIDLLRHNNIIWNILFFTIGILLVVIFGYLFVGYWVLDSMIG